MRYPAPQGKSQLGIGTRIATVARPPFMRTRSMAVTNQALPGGYQLLNYRIDRQISRGGLFDRLPRVRRDWRAGRDQGIPAVVAGAAHRGRHRARELGREPDRRSATG